MLYVTLLSIANSNICSRVVQQSESSDDDDKGEMEVYEGDWGYIFGGGWGGGTRGLYVSKVYGSDEYDEDLIKRGPDADVCTIVEFG